MASTPTPTPETPTPSPSPSPLPGGTSAPTYPPPSTPLPSEWADYFNFWTQQINPAPTTPSTTTNPTQPGGTTVPPLSAGDIAKQIAKAIAGAGAASKPVDPTVSQATTAYLSIWGVTPPHGYIESLVHQGMNVYEIVQHELSKPAADKTSYWRDREASIASTIAIAFGRR